MKNNSFGAKLASFFGLRKTLDESFFEDLEDILIEGDFGSRLAYSVCSAVREKKPENRDEFLKYIREEIGKTISSTELIPSADDLSVYLFLGVNGVGKTTTVAKLADYYKKKNYKVVLAASDTFRAAAIDQLLIHGQKTGVRTVKQENGSDPGAVIYDAISSSLARKDNLILCDTAGRMHNKEDLMKELQKIDKIIRARIKPENYRKILVIDATTGQNAVSQAELFDKAIGIDALVLTKYDSLAKGGVLSQINIPVAFVGTGEKYSDISVFDRDEFLSFLTGIRL